MDANALPTYRSYNGEIGLQFLSKQVQDQHRVCIWTTGAKVWYLVPSLNVLRSPFLRGGKIMHENPQFGDRKPSYRNNAHPDGEGAGIEAERRKM